MRMTRRALLSFGESDFCFNLVAVESEYDSEPGGVLRSADIAASVSRQDDVLEEAEASTFTVGCEASARRTDAGVERHGPIDHRTILYRGRGRFKQTVTESSFDAWTRFYKQDENAPNAIVSYYAKGALVALALDLVIRDKSDGAFSLDDVMRWLWQHHALHHRSDYRVLAWDDQIHISTFDDGLRLFRAAPLAYSMCAGPGLWAAACNTSVSDVQKRMDASRFPVRSPWHGQCHRPNADPEGSTWTCACVSIDLWFFIAFNAVKFTVPIDKFSNPGFHRRRWAKACIPSQVLYRRISFRHIPRLHRHKI